MRNQNDVLANSFGVQEPISLHLEQELIFFTDEETCHLRIEHEGQIPVTSTIVHRIAIQEEAMSRRGKVKWPTLLWGLLLPFDALVLSS